MNSLFLAVLNMSLTASYVILFVIVVRLFLKKVPKFISYALWGVVAFRLIVPFSFESVFSLLPRNMNFIPVSHDITNLQSPQINGVEVVDPFISNDQFINEQLSAPHVEAGAIEESVIGAGLNPLRIFVETGSYIWVLGTIALLVYSFLSVLLLKRQLKSARLIGENIFEAENLRTPFVLGLISPRIYLPAGLEKEERNYILVHEQTHICRKDHIIKALAFLIVAVHWFNPLVWIAFRLMSTDMELSCDEKVLRVMKEDIKKPYAQSLLSLAAGRHILSGSPLAFGEGNVKVRIKNVLNYKKPRFWIVLLSVIIVAAIGMGLAANPRSEASFNGFSYKVEEILYQAGIYSFAYTLDTAPRYSISSDYILYGKQVNDEDWQMHGVIHPCKISKQELNSLFIPPFVPPYDNIEKVIDQVKLIYRTDTGDDNNTFYLVMQLRNGDILLAAGYDNEDFRHIRWLFRLEKTGDFDDESVDKNPDDENVSNDNQNTVTRELVNENTEMQKEGNEKGIGNNEEKEIAEFVEKNLEIIMSSPKGASDPNDYIKAHQEEYEIIKKIGGEKALQYMLSQFESGNAEGLRGYIMMQLCKELLGIRNNVTDENLAPQEWYEALSIRQEIKLPDFKYEGNDPIEKLVYDTEIKKYSQPQRGFTIVAPKIFGSYEEGRLLKVFVTTYSATYRLYGNVLELMSGSVVPSAITYKKDESGNYVPEKYEQAKDGADWMPSIKKFCTMPLSGKKIPGLADKIIEHYQNYDDIRALHWENLSRHLIANGIKRATLFNSRGEVEFSVSRPEYVD